MCWDQSLAFKFPQVDLHSFFSQAVDQSNLGPIAIRDARRACPLVGMLPRAKYYLHLWSQASSVLRSAALNDAQQSALPGIAQLRAYASSALIDDLGADVTRRLESLQQKAPAYNLQQSVLQEGSRRTGVIAVKVGMSQEWDEWGQRLPLTILWIDECEVVQTKTEDKEGYFSMQLGVGAKKDKQLHPRQVGHFTAADVGNKRNLAEFRVTADALLPPKTKITAAHFTAGQFVDVQGTTIGKGFQGVMKKWGFAGQPASHGNSKAHRKAGGIGACQDPGKVWPGKKMPGRMGGVTRTVLSAQVFKVDPLRNLLYVKGQVPGHKGNFVRVKDAVKKRFAEQPQRPFPTFLEQYTGGVSYAPKEEHNPFEPRER